MSIPLGIDLGITMFAATPYDDYAALKSSNEPSRGVGSIWHYGPFRAEEVAIGGDITTVGGVELDVLAGDDGSFSFEAYGIAADGVTDDITIIDTTIATISAGGGGLIRLPAGTILTSSKMQMKSNVTVVGAGDGATILDTVFAIGSGGKQVVNDAGVLFDGVADDDDYATETNATGDYFTVGPLEFAAASTLKSGDISFTAKTVGEVSGLVAGDWLYLSEGIASWHPAKSEFVQVASVASAVVTLRTKLKNSYSNVANSLGEFIRDYDLVVSPGGGGAGYPDMSTWSDVGFRKVTPIVNAHIRDFTIKVTRDAADNQIGFMFHLCVGCSADVTIEDGTFWNIDSQDISLRVRGGSTLAQSSYVGNGCNVVRCDIDVSNQVAIEEGAQNISGIISANGYNTIKDYVNNVDISFYGSAGATPGLEVSTVRNVNITPGLKAQQAAIKNITPVLETMATDLPEAYLTNEVMEYYSCGLTLIGGECESVDSPASSIETTNDGQIRCIDTKLPVAPTDRYKGTIIVDGARHVQGVTTAPLYSDIEAGENFHSGSYGAVEVVGMKETIVFSQFNFPGTLDTLIVNDITTDGKVEVGDIAVFRVSDSAAAPVNWGWQVAEVVSINVASKAVVYSPANAASRTAITASGENTVKFYRVKRQFDVPVIKTAGSGFDAEHGGFVTGIGRTDGAPLQLGAYHLWVDATGDLRIKSGAPISDTDGTVVGTQT